jgi:hypothetical protein
VLTPSPTTIAVGVGLNRIGSEPPRLPAARILTEPSHLIALSQAQEGVTRGGGQPEESREKGTGSESIAVDAGRSSCTLMLDSLGCDENGGQSEVIFANHSLEGRPTQI